MCMMNYMDNQVFADRYNLISRLGRGGFSEVWLAEDIYTRLRVAIKIYAPCSNMDDSGAGIFSHEFALLFGVNHGNLLKPTHYAVWRVGTDKIPYLVMPYCERGSVENIKGQMCETEIWKMFRDVACGLACLHAMNPPIIHKDIKPDNILISNDGTYMISDFGISAQIRNSSLNNDKDGLVGTCAYLGPEMFRRDAEYVKATDIWALGATVYEAITGHVPFEIGGGMMNSGEIVPRLECCSPELDNLVHKCLSLYTWDRPKAEDIVSIIDNIRTGNNVSSWGSSSYVYGGGTMPQSRIKDEKGYISNTNKESKHVDRYHHEDIIRKEKIRQVNWLYVVIAAVVLVVFGVFAMMIIANNDPISTSKAVVEFNAEEGSDDVEVLSKYGPWEIESIPMSDAEWLQTNKNDGVIKIKVAQNTTNNKRSCTIKVKKWNGNYARIEINQEAPKNKRPAPGGTPPVNKPGSSDNNPEEPLGIYKIFDKFEENYPHNEIQ